VSREFQLNAFELPYILTLPILRQQFVNWADAKPAADTDA
ncbi:MAG: hypothetical protein QOD39_2513, partial [Mycobacterium sp.]|nr:hypothetical protein [Mycobacterium sp.]